ncbi:MAG TPA: ABC transporter permease [Vicinamibacterales bacterium]|nr:ABC transporter permease [Vicinamibacterales bacterium]
MTPDAIWRDVRFAARVLRRSYGFTLVAVLTLAVGVGGSTALFSIIRGALLARWPYDGYERLVTFRAESPRLGRREFPLWSAAEFREIAARGDLFDAVIAGEGRGVTVGLDGGSERVGAGAMTANAWAMLGVPPALGRVFTAEDDRPGAAPVVVASDRFWRTRLGARRDVIGRELRIDRVPFTIVGVMPPAFVWWDQDLYLPLQIDPANVDRADRRWYVQARLRPQVTLARAEAALESTAARWHDEAPRLPEYENLRITLHPLVAETLRDVRQVLYLLLAAVALVLGVASANVATLLLIRGVRRRGEIAVRLALGAPRARIALELLTESALVSVVAGAAGLWLGSVLLQPLVSLIPFGIPAEAHIRVDWRLGAFAIGVALVFGLAAAIVPAVRAIQVNVADDIKDGGRRGAGTVPRSLDVFMAVQFLVALIVLSSTFAVVRGFQQTLAADPGFDANDVLTFRIAFASAADAGSERTRDLLHRLAAMPGVTAAAAGTSVPVGEGRRASFAIEGDEVRVDANVDAVSPRYFAVLRTPIVDGRDIADTDEGTRPRIAIVNATAASRLSPSRSIIGRRIVWREHGGVDVGLTVVGVAADMRREGVVTPAAPAVFVPVAQEPAAALSVLLRTTGAQAALFAAARSVVAGAAPDIPVYAPRTLSSLRRDALGSERLAAVLLTAFGVVALALSTIGIYGVTRYLVEQRRDELGLRLALGADPRGLVALVLRRTAATLAAGAIAGVGCSWVAMRLLAAVIVGVRPNSVLACGAAGVPLIVAAVIAAYLPARRAAAIDPAAVFH